MYNCTVKNTWKNEKVVYIDTFKCTIPQLQSISFEPYLFKVAPIGALF